MMQMEMLPEELVETDELATPDRERDDVNWYLSPGYCTHLHAYELAMLPVERGIPLPAVEQKRS